MDISLLLILHHLFRVSSESVDFVTKRFLFFFHFVVANGQLVHPQGHFFALSILILISFEELPLSSLVLLVVAFQVSEFTVELVQVVFVLLDHSLGLADSGEALAKLVFLLGKKGLN